MRPYSIDGNHTEIVKALKREGASVTSLAMVGDGVPDLLVGYMGTNLLMEVKTPKGGLTPAQKKWHRRWQGQKAVVRTVRGAVLIVRKLARGSNERRTLELYPRPPGPGGTPD